MRQVEAVGEAGHGLEAHYIARLGRINDRDRKFRAELDGNFPALRFERELAVRIHATEHIVQLASGQRSGIRQIHWFGFAGRNQLGRKHVVLAHRQVHLPLIARHPGDLIPGMKPDDQRHGIG